MPSFTREFCEAQYDPFLTAPDAREVNEHRLRLSAAARETLAGHRDVRYGAREKELLDIYPPPGESRGVAIYLHGGYWRSMDKQDYAFLASAFVPAGFTLVLPNYDLAPEVTLDTIVDEVRTACAWVWRNIAHFGGDRDRLCVAGNSAGAHLAAMMAITDWRGVDPSLPARLMKCGVMLSGLYDLEPLLLTTVNDALRLDAQAARRNSPALHSPKLDGPLLLAVGGRESAEFQRQTDTLYIGWQSVPIRRRVVPARHHFDLLLDLADENSALFIEARDAIQDAFRATY